jgi:uncharacterized membrane protein (DUF4010 family)
MGALGGLVSSTMVTLTFSRQSRSDPDSSIPLAVGTVAACTVVVPRVLGLILILNPELLPGAALGLAPILAAGTILLLLAWKQLRAARPERAPPAPSNPLQLRAALLMAIGFQIVLVALEAVAGRFGESGVLASALVLGLTDMDALTFGMSRLAEAPDLRLTAALAVVTGVTANSVFKAALSGALGHARFRRMALPGLLVLAAAGVAGFWLLSWTA